MTTCTCELIDESYLLYTLVYGYNSATMRNIYFRCLQLSLPVSTIVSTSTIVSFSGCTFIENYKLMHLAYRTHKVIQVHDVCK